MAGGVHPSVLLAARGSVSGASTSTCRLVAQASCTPDEPEPALTSARGSMIAGWLERTDKMPARAEEQLLFGSGALSSTSSPRQPRWLLTVSFTSCDSPQLQRTAPKVRGPPGLRGLPGSTSRQRAVANSVPIPTVCGRPGKPLVLFANRAGA
ncbi:hypothetical protein GGF50DRAFT_125657 [Schizophyllum commune]